MITEDNLSIRKMQDIKSDYNLMLHWLNTPLLLEYYEGRDKKFDIYRIKSKYQPRILGKEKTIPHIAQIDNIPIGYLQFTELDEKQKAQYELNKNDLCYGIDMFIGETEYLNKGLGTKLLKMLVKYIFTELNADLITIDPRVENFRAIRAYEKVGYKKNKILPKHELHEGKYHDNWLMIIKKASLLK
jgi:aminoglycoside 6'-N-acetyltransferase